MLKILFTINILKEQTIGKNMKKLFLIILFFTTSCKADTFDMYREEIKELIINPKKRTFKGGESDVDNLNECPWLFEQKWIYSDKWNDWSPRQEWYNGTIITSAGVSVDPKQNLSNIIIKNLDKYPIYLGPWRSITLTHTEGSFPFYKTIKETKSIRFFAYQSKEGGPINYQYESLTEENKNIPEKKFSLSPNSKYPPDKFSLCVVKWTAKYGYNAIAEVKSKNPFSKNYLIPTGRIMNAE